MNEDLRPDHYAEVLPKLAGNRLKVLEALQAYGPATAIEIAKTLWWDKTSVRPRLCELRDMGLVTATGERRNKEHVFMVVPHETQMEMIA